MGWEADIRPSRLNDASAPRADITLSSQEGMFGEGQLPVTQDDITALEVLRVDGLLLGLRLSMPGAYGVITS
jgi:hypothetical protein